MEEIIKWFESIRDICNARSDMAIGKGKIAWAGYANTADDALAMLKEQPQIVRCKDCKYWIGGGIDEKDNFIPPKCGMNNGLHPSADWFCADGERKEGR